MNESYQSHSQLLTEAQQYLRVQSSRQQPDASLTAAWDNFHRILSRFIRGVVHAHGLRGPDAEDCLQEVWFELIRRLPDFRHREDGSGFGSWLYLVVRSKASRIWRRQSVRRVESLHETAEPVAKLADPATTAVAKCERARLLQEVSKLKSEASQVNARLFQMRLIEGRDVAEVAAALSLAPQQVWYRQHRMLTKLRACLISEGDDDAT